MIELLFAAATLFAPSGHAETGLRAVELSQCQPDRIVVRLQQDKTFERREFELNNGRLAGISFSVEGSRDHIHQEFMKADEDGQPTYFLRFLVAKQGEILNAIFSDFETYRALCAESAAAPRSIRALELDTTYYWH